MINILTSKGQWNLNSTCTLVSEDALTAIAVFSLYVAIYFESPYVASVSLNFTQASELAF